MLDRLAAPSTSESVDWADFERDTSLDLEKLENAIFEMSRVVAGLAAIDGAVVLDKSFALLGFGAEVSSEIPPPPRVWRALDPEGERREVNAVEDVGTRHRAAYRFVRQHPRGLAIVISHDGGVSFVANREGEVVSWLQSVSR
jgi:DNA integrity scanning protein DisA with diadenylate cyclase activity